MTSRCYSDAKNVEKLVSVILLAIVIISTLLLSAIFGRAFRTAVAQESISTSLGSNSEILKALTEGSDQELKEVLDDPRIKMSVLQLQHLGLTREERRRRNRRLVLSMADSQAKSFIALKKRISKETCSRIIDDFGHRPSCRNNLMEKVG